MSRAPGSRTAFQRPTTGHSLVLLDDREDVARRVLEPRDERAAPAVDALGVDEVVVLELDAPRGELVDRRLDVGDGEVEDRERRGRVLGALGVDDRVPVAGDVQRQDAVLLGDPQAEYPAIELLGLLDVVYGEPAERLGVLEHACSSFASLLPLETTRPARTH